MYASTCKDNIGFQYMYTGQGHIFHDDTQNKEQKKCNRNTRITLVL